MKKIYGSAAEALEGVLHDGMLIAAGGFGLCGIPELLLNAIRDAGTKDLAFASNNAASLSWNSTRKAPWPNVCVRVVRAFPVSIPKPALAP